VWPLYAFVVLRQTLQAQHRMFAIVVTIAAANVVNGVLNYAWIFGELGFPALGVFGSAHATTVSRWLMPALLLALAWRHLEPHLRPLAPRVFAPAPLARMLRLGAPIGGQVMLEVGAFSAVAVLMGWLGVEAMAAHQIAINLASLAFMVPLGVGSAAAVIVGHAVGRGDAGSLRRAATAALLVGAGFMGLTGAAFIGLPVPLASLYTNVADVVALAVVLLPIAGVFQIFDGLQAVAIGVLRGLGDTRVPLIVNIVGFWVIGIPVSLLLGFGLGLGARGLWWGLVAGLFMVAAILLVRVAHRLRYAVERVVIDEPGT
jgi:MATE family multidrug resistance protein